MGRRPFACGFSGPRLTKIGHHNLIPRSGTHAAGPATAAHLARLPPLRPGRHPHLLLRLRLRLRHTHRLAPLGPPVPGRERPPPPDDSSRVRPTSTRSLPNRAPPRRLAEHVTAADSPPHPTTQVVLLPKDEKLPRPVRRDQSWAQDGRAAGRMDRRVRRARGRSRDGGQKVHTARIRGVEDEVGERVGERADGGGGERVVV